MATNYALQGTPSCSTGATSGIGRINDGNTSSDTYFSIGAGLSYVTIDFGFIAILTNVKVWHYYADGRTYNATRTQVSLDGVTWTDVFNSASAGTYAETSSGRNYPVPENVKYVRYIRDYLNGSSANTSSHWVEVEGWGDETTNYNLGFLKSRRNLGSVSNPLGY